MHPLETLRYVLLEKGVEADNCGVLKRAAGPPTRRHRPVEIDLASCGFSPEDQRDLMVVEYLPEPVVPKPAPPQPATPAVTAPAAKPPTRAPVAAPPSTPAPAVPKRSTRPIDRIFRKE